MRVLIVLLAFVVLGTTLLPSRETPQPPGPVPGQALVPGLGQAQTPQTQTPGPGLGQVTASSPPPAGLSLPSGAREVAIPPAIAAPAPIDLPPTLEMVALPSLPGSAAAPARTITRAEAVAAAIASPEFQETVSPLARLYLATFGRYPDYEGLNYYTGQREEARPLHEIATEFVGSQEFEQRYGTLDNAQFVELIFTNVLGHPSQADVRSYWVEEIAAGRMTRGEVLVDLAESGAFRERSANQVFVSTAYTEVLRRTPDPAGYDYWVGQLRAGQTPRSVINGLLGRP